MGRSADTVPSDSAIKTVADVWRHVARGVELPDNTLVAVNKEYASLAHEVREGDEVAFFPPVTGG
jgi:molybdopterin synthase sulfur carrier subunit